MINTNTNQEFTSTMTKSYWCHICKIEFSRIFIEGIEVFCRSCNKSFCEDLSIVENETDHPSNFVPYSNNLDSSVSSPSDSSSNDSDRVILYPIGNRTRSRPPFLELISSMMGAEEYGMDGILNYIMQTDMNRYGNPPASKSAVDNLHKFEVTEQFLSEKMNKEKEKENELEFHCSVCKDEFEIGNMLVKIPCKHNFHEECILPWLKERNSCPTCRYELPTDDTEYEERRERKMTSASTNI